MKPVHGSTRLLLVVVFTAAALLLTGSVLVLLRSDPVSEPDSDAGGDVRLFPKGDAPRGDRRRSRGDGGEGGDDDIYDWDGRVQEGSREPSGPLFVVTADSLRDVLADRHWEEIRRQIDVLQRNGEEVPEDVTAALIALLEGTDTRIDAVLALGGVTSDAAGTALAEHATNLSQPLDVRAAALDALARNGSQAALTLVQGLVADPNLDPSLLRHAAPALAAIGGQEAARTLVGLLQRNQDRRIEGMIVQALGAARGAGDVLAQTIRQARDTSDEQLASLVVRVARLHGPQADTALRLEIRRMIEDPTAIEFVEDENARLKLRGSALTAAAAIGGELLDPVIRIVQNDSEGLGNVALHCLRKARGDEAAKKVAPLLQSNSDPRFQREVAVVLGATRSFAATDPLVALLDADDQNTRHAAAHGLSLVRDPAAVRPLLDRLDGARDDHQMAMNIIDALGTIGVNDALPKLRELRDSDEPEWEQLRPWIRRALARIESGNPDTTRME